MERDIAQITTTTMKGGVPNFSVATKNLDEPGAQNVNFWDSPNWSIYLGYLKQIPEYRNAVRALAIYTAGRGWKCPLEKDRISLERIRGWGEDTFDSIMQDMVIVKKTNGDAFAEVTRNDNGSLINIKKLNPKRVRIYYGEDGLITNYAHQQANGEWKDLKTSQVLHLCNDRIANEIHGTSVLESCRGVIDWLNEMLSDLRRLMHRSSLRVIYVDMDNAAALTTIDTEWKNAIKNGEVLILPGKRGVDFEIVDYPVPPTAAWMEVIRFARDYFYEVLGVPKVITGGTQESTEASSKIGYQTFEQPYITEQRLLEQDIWNQLGIRIKFDRPTSLLSELADEQQANQSQTGFQPSEMMAGRNE